MKFGELLTKFIDRSGLTITNIANSISVTLPYITNVQAGRKPPFVFEKCEKLSEVLNLTDAERKLFFKAAYEGRTGKNAKFITATYDDMYKFYAEAKTEVKKLKKMLEKENKDLKQEQSALEDLHKVSQELNMKQHLDGDIIEALNDPVAVKALLVTHKNSEDIKMAIRHMLDCLPSLPLEKRQALLALCK